MKGAREYNEGKSVEERWAEKRNRENWGERSGEKKRAKERRGEMGGENGKKGKMSRKQGR